MSENTGRAWLQPLSTEGAPEGEPLPLDFNPESLRIQINPVLRNNTAKGGSDQSANGRSTSTLSFEATFDNTGPPRAPLAPSGGGISASVNFSVGVSVGGDDELDVRRKTGRIASWVSGPREVADARAVQVEFRWGRMRWRGVISSFSETLDYFSPEGTPLRSKVSLTLTEATVEDRRPAEERKSLALSLGFAAGASVALDFSASAGFGLGASASLGAGVDLGFSANAGVQMSADVAVGVFGGGAVSAAFGGGADLSVAGKLASIGSNTAPSLSTPTAWAPTGPAAGTAAAATAAAVSASRAGGGAAALPDPAADSFRATQTAAPPNATGPTAASRLSAQIQAGSPISASRVTPLPVFGSPPRSYPTPSTGVSIASAHRVAPTPAATVAPRRPRWEQLPAASPTPGAHDRACGCARCEGAR